MCLLGACQGDAKITQTPSLVLERGHTAYLRCEQTYGHNNMFWYRQDPDQGMQFLIYFYNKEQNDKGKITDRFQADQPQNELFRLNISQEYIGYDDPSPEGAPYVFGKHKQALITSARKEAELWTRDT
ncbi:unnamed protein product [Caretta caretta]